MPIKAFDAPTLRALRPEIDTALAPLGERHGITLRTGNGSYSGATAHFKLELAVIGDDGNAVSKEVEAFNKLHSMFGLEQGDLGLEFVSGRERFRLTGIAPGRTKYPIVTERLRDGKTIFHAEEVVERIKAARTKKG